MGASLRTPLPLEALWQKRQAPKDLLAAGELLDVGAGDRPRLPQVLHAQTIAHCAEGQAVKGPSQPPHGRQGLKLQGPVHSPPPPHRTLTGDMGDRVGPIQGGPGQRQWKERTGSQEGLKRDGYAEGQSTAWLQAWPAVTSGTGSAAFLTPLGAILSRHLLVVQGTDQGAGSHVRGQVVV